MSVSVLENSSALLSESRSFLMEQRMKAENKEKIYNKLEQLGKELDEDIKQLDNMLRAATLIGNVADDNTKFILSRITKTINDSLAVMFVKDKRRVSIKQIMYRNTYPHFVVELETEDGVKRSFKQSGTGLGQVISFMFTMCLISARNGRQVIVMDELLNGLHPDAKKTIKGLIEVFSSTCQFIIVEYGMDIGKQYEVVKTGSIASVLPHEGIGYYKELGLKAEDEKVEGVL